MDIFATIFAAGVPQNGLTDPPEIQITDDAATIVQAFVAMTDLVVDGKHVFAFTIPDVARSYTFLVDADPLVSSQVPASDRYYFGGFSGEADIIAVSTDLANLDVAVSSRNATVPLAAAVDQAEHDATQAAIAAQVVPMDAATSQAEHDNTQVGIGLNLAAIASLDTFIQGGREIDFVGDDVAGWQRVERDIGGSILRRYDLFDEADVRINETVATFIGRQGMIARETISP